MAFVRKVKTASGATAVQIAERVGGRDKVLEHLGSAHTDAELTALLVTARDRLHPGQGELDLSSGRVPSGYAVITGKRHAVLWQLQVTRPEPSAYIRRCRRSPPSANARI